MSQKQIKSALLSVFYKDGLKPLVEALHQHQVTLYSTGGTQKFIEELGIPCVAVESLTSYPSILGGRVKTLHPKVFGGILGRRALDTDRQEMQQYEIPEIDLVIVDLYPFEETLQQTDEEAAIIEKIDIGGPTMIRAAAKNFRDVTVLAAKEDYAQLTHLIQTQHGATTLEQRKQFAAKAFRVVMNYDIAIDNYFNGTLIPNFRTQNVLRYGENPHQQGSFYGDLDQNFEKLNGKALSYNNLVDADAALQLMADFKDCADAVFAIIKHTNVCGIAQRATLSEAWDAALAGDPESAFGGVLICNRPLDPATAEKMNTLFFEVLIAPGFEAEALSMLKSKKNRILLEQKSIALPKTAFRNVLNGVLTQDIDSHNVEQWKETGSRTLSEREKEDLLFGNIVCKHLKSNAIALVKDKQLLGKGCGQTSRVDALRQAIAKAESFSLSLEGAGMASDAFFPFDDCVRLAHEAGIRSVIQPGGSVRDEDSIRFCEEHDMAMVLTGTRHFKH